MNELEESLKCDETLSCTCNVSIFILFYSWHVLVESATQKKNYFSLKKKKQTKNQCGILTACRVDTLCVTA